MIIYNYNSISKKIFSCCSIAKITLISKFTFTNKERLIKDNRSYNENQRKKFEIINLNNIKKIIEENKKYKIIFNYSVISTFIGLLWYFLYYSNRKIIKDFIDYEIKRAVNTLTMKNSTIISIIASQIYKYCSKESSQKKINEMIKREILQNEEVIKNIMDFCKIKIIEFLSSEEGQKQINKILKIILENNKEEFANIILEYANGNKRDDIINLMSDKFIQMINEQSFKDYVFQEVAKEFQSSLQNKENVLYSINTINQQLKI